MDNHEQLVKALRCCTQNPPETCVGCTYNIGNNECAVRGMMCDAAAAIEELQDKVVELEEELNDADVAADDNGRQIEALEAEVKQAAKRNAELHAELEKWVSAAEMAGLVVRCKECIHFTQSGWCDREFDWFPVDENGFCSMAEKMEVQDGENREF